MLVFEKFYDWEDFLVVFVRSFKVNYLCLYPVSLLRFNFQIKKIASFFITPFSLFRFAVLHGVYSTKKLPRLQDYLELHYNQDQLHDRRNFQDQNHGHFHALFQAQDIGQAYHLIIFHESRILFDKQYIFNDTLS